MQKEIKYRGMSTVPDDYGCPDGDLALMVNLVNEGGSIRPIETPAVHSALSTSYKILYVHKVAAAELYILQNKSTNALYFCTRESNAFTVPVSISLVAINPTIISNGNIITIRHDSGLFYLIYKDGTYKYLGDKLPEIDIRFDPTANLNLGFTTVEDDATNTLFRKTFSPLQLIEDTGMSSFLEIMQGEIAKSAATFKEKSLSENGQTNEYFVFPMFLRYAIRLYDGTLVSHSAPILLRPSFSSMDVALINSIYQLNEDSDIIFALVGRLHLAISAYGIQYKLLSSTISQDFAELIEGIDVFLSSECYNIDIDQKVTLEHQDQFLDQIDLTGQSHTTIPGQGEQYPLSYFRVKAKESFLDDLKTSSLFYKVKSLKVEEITATVTDLTIESDILKTLTAQQTMTDDFRTHCQLYPAGIFSYNNRANIFNMKTKLFSGFTPAVFAYKVSEVGSTKAIVKIKKNDGLTATVIAESTGSFYKPPYFFYPERTAESLTMYYVNGSNVYSTTVQLKPHPFLNGAYYLNETLAKTTLSDSTAVTHAESENYIYAKNQVKVSEVDNPFLFPAVGSVTVGNGTVLALASTSQALSQDNFGNFPLQAFTTEGVWALEVSSTGTYNSKQPATRDIISDPNSLIQVDGGVVFASDKGIMLLQGSNSICLTDILESDKMISYSLSQLEAVLAAMSVETFNYTDVSIKSFLSGCGIAYDYTHSRLIVFNSSKSFSFVYSFKWKTWTLMSGTLSEAVNDYPTCYVRSGNNILDLSEEDSNAITKGLMITRPLKLDAPDILKTVSDVVHRGIFNNKIKSALYGSVDGYTFYLAASSTTKEIRNIHGSPFKNFVLVIGSSMIAGESLSGTSLLFEPKRNNKLR